MWPNRQVARLLSSALVLLATTVSEASDQPINTPSVVIHAYRLRVQGKLDEARRQLQNYLKGNPADAFAWYELSRLEFQAGGAKANLQPATDAIGKAMTLAPKEGKYHRLAAEIAAYDAVLKSHTNHQPAVKQRIVQAIAHAQEAIRCNADDHAARKLLVALYGNNPASLGGDSKLVQEHLRYLEEHSRFDAAEAKCTFTLKNDPQKRVALWESLAQKEPRVQENLAKEYARAGDAERAEACAEITLSLDPSRTDVLLQVGRYLALGNQLKPAERFLQRFLQSQPPPHVAYRAWATMALAQVKRMGGDSKAAIPLFESARKADPYLWLTQSPPPRHLFDSPKD